jgi:transposase
MIGTTLQARIFVCTQDTDMRKSFNALFSIIKSAMHLDPLTGYLFVFKNKRADRIKVVYWEGDGFAMWYKVLQKGTFQFPDLANFSSAGIEIDPSTLSLILQGIDLASIRRRNRYKLPERFSENQPPTISLLSPFEGDSPDLPPQ